jgi:hypothetical protein
MTLKEQALEAYDRGDRLSEIAGRLGKSPSQVSHWAKTSGRPRRPRGNRKQEKPSEHVQAILRLAARYSYRQVAKMVGGTSQNVCEVCHKWSERWWKIEPLFQPGDMILWYNMRFTVISVNGHLSGVVQDDSGQTIYDFQWSDGRNRAILAPAV